MSPTTIRRTTGVAFGAVAVVLLIISTLAFRTVHRSADANRLVAHTYDVLSAVERVRTAIVRAETTARPFAILGQRDADPFEQASADLKSGIDQVAALTADDPVQQRNVSQLRIEASATIQLLRDRISRAPARSTPANEADREMADVNAAGATLQRMRLEEERLMGDRIQNAAGTDLQTRALMNGLIAVAFGVLALSFLFADRRGVELARLTESLARRVRERTAEIEAAFAGETRARLEAEQARARFQRLIEAAPTAIVAVDATGRIVLVNALTERLFGYAPGELVGRPVTVLVPEHVRGAHDDYRTDYARAPQMRQMGEGRELYGVRQDGTEVPVEIGLSPIDVDGDVLVLASIADITDRKRFEAEREHLLARFEALIDHAPIGIALFDTDRRYISINDRGAAPSGIPKEAFVGRLPGKLGPWGARVEALLQQVVDSRAGVGADVAGEAPARPGEEGHWTEEYFPVLNRRGDVLAVGAIAIDVTERRRADEERARLLEREQQARTEADAANRSKDVFLARVSHELRTPLNALRGWARMLRDGQVPPDRARHAIAAIDRNGEMLTTLVEDLLDMSRITTGRLDLSRRHLDVAALARDAVTLLEPAAQAKNIAVEVEIEPRPLIVDGDATRLRQVMWNLLSNAVKFTPADGRVTLHVGSSSESVHIEVADTGQGIAPEFLPRVFEPFSQAEQGGQGLGLGLAIVQQLVAAHGGRITVASRGVGAGATFTVTLPLVRVPESV